MPPACRPGIVGNSPRPSAPPQGPRSVSAGGGREGLQACGGLHRVHGLLARPRLVQGPHPLLGNAGRQGPSSPSAARAGTAASRFPVGIEEGPLVFPGCGCWWC